MLSIKKFANVLMLLIMLGSQFLMPSYAAGGRRWWCRHHNCYHNYGYYCNYHDYSHFHSSGYCSDDYFVRVGNALRDDAREALLVQIAANTYANAYAQRALSSGVAILPQQVAPAPVQAPVYQTPSYQAPAVQQPVYQQPAYQQPAPQQPVQQTPIPVPNYNYSQMQSASPMNNVPQYGVPQGQQAPLPEQYQTQQPNYYVPNGQQSTQQPAKQHGQQPGQIDPFPQQPYNPEGTPGPPATPSGQQGQSGLPAPPADTSQPGGVAAYIAALKPAVQVIMNDHCVKCHGTETFAQKGGNVDLSNIDAITSDMAEKMFFEVYTGNMPRGEAPLAKEKYDILSDWAIILKSQGK